MKIEIDVKPNERQQKAMNTYTSVRRLTLKIIIAHNTRTTFKCALKESALASKMQYVK